MSALEVVAGTGQQEHSELTAEQIKAIDFERNATRREALDFLVKDGDLSAAWFRVSRGFQRQLRLAGLERIVRESMETEETE